MDNEELNCSLSSYSFDEKQQNLLMADEMPRFSISPGRECCQNNSGNCVTFPLLWIQGTISPIDEDFLLDLDSLSSPASLDEELFQPISSCNLVSFSEIDAKITPLKTTTKGLETIFEGRFLETPPRGGGRTVIPRKDYDQTDGDSEEDEHPIRPICDSSYEIIMYEDEETLCCTSPMKAQRNPLMSKEEDGEEAVSIICNSFKRRLNLIPGEDWCDLDDNI